MSVVKWIIANEPNVEHVKQIGTGGTGEVHEVSIFVILLIVQLFNKDTGKGFARKIVRIFGQVTHEDLANEAKAVKRLSISQRHPNIILFLADGFRTEHVGKYYFVDMELCDLNLHDYIHGDRNNFDDGYLSHPVFLGNNATTLEKMRNVWQVMIDISKGLEFLHLHGQVHRDIKPRNILYSKKEKAWKITDFGASSEATSKTAQSTVFGRGTASYRAPELLQNRQFTNKVDIWALGCVLFELICRKSAFGGDWDTMQGRIPTVSIPSIPFPLQNHIQETLHEMLNFEWQRRPSARGVRSACVVHASLLLEPTVTRNINDLFFIPLYPDYKRIGQAASSRNEFLTLLGESSTTCANRLPQIENQYGETALYWAAGQGNSDVVEILLPLSETDKLNKRTGETVLHSAARSGKPETLQILLEKTHLNIDAKDDDGSTALCRAAWNGHSEAVDLLLRKGACISDEEPEGLNALGCAAFRGHNEIVSHLLEKGWAQSQWPSALHNAVVNGHLEVTLTFIKHECELTRRDASGQSCFHWAAAKGWTLILSRLLEAEPSGAGLLNENNETPLHWASLAGQSKAAQLLLDLGSDSLFQKDRIGRTVLAASYWGADNATVYTILSAYAKRLERPELKLHIAVWNGELKIVKDLLDSGYDANSRSAEDDIALHWAAAKNDVNIVKLLLVHNSDVSAKNGEGCSPLDFAARAGHKAVADELLRAGANVSARTNDGTTALHWAAWNGHVDVAKRLIEASADVSAPSNIGATPLHWAARRGHLQVVKALLNAGAGVEARYVNGDTPLHRAVRCGVAAIVKLLLDAGADVTAQNKDGATALHVAAQQDHLEILSLLLDAGANVSSTTIRGETPLHWAVRRRGNMDPSLFFDLPKGDIKVAMALLEAGSDLLAQNERDRTPLHVAAMDGDETVVRILMEATTSERFQNVVGGKELHKMVTKSRYTKSERFLTPESIESVDIFARNDEGETALHLAAKKGDVEMVKTLLDMEDQIREAKIKSLKRAASEIGVNASGWEGWFTEDAEQNTLPQFSRTVFDSTTR